MSFRKQYTHVSQYSTTKFDSEIARHGKYFILVRTDQRIRCPNVDPVTSECSPQCPICFGLGFNFQYETHIMRKSLDTNTNRGSEEFIPYTFFIDTSVVAKETDQILEVSWSGGIVSRILAVFEIIDVNLYDLGSAPAYQIADCVKESVSSKNHNLKYLQSIISLGITND